MIKSGRIGQEEEANSTGERGKSENEIGQLGPNERAEHVDNGRNHAPKTTETHGTVEQRVAYARGKHERRVGVGAVVGSRAGRFAQRDERDYDDCCVRGRVAESMSQRRLDERDEETREAGRGEESDKDAFATEFVVEMTRKVADEFGQRRDCEHEIRVGDVLEIRDTFLK